MFSIFAKSVESHRQIGNLSESYGRQKRDHGIVTIKLNL